MENFALFGTLVNVVLVLIGSGAGLIVKKVTGGKGKEQGRIGDAALTAIGLCTLLIGITGAIKGAVNGQIMSANPEATYSGISGENTLVIIILLLCF